MRAKAVIFDLWETLIDWDRESAAQMQREVDALVGNGFAERWDSSDLRYVAPIRTASAWACRRLMNPAMPHMTRARP